MPAPLFLLRYAESEDLRRCIGRQLNKGEELHALRRFLFFANRGHVRTRQPDEQTQRACAPASSPTPSYSRNTVRYGEILEGLRTEGYTVKDEDVAHLSGGCRERAANTQTLRRWRALATDQRRILRARCKTPRRPPAKDRRPASSRCSSTPTALSS